MPSNEYEYIKTAESIWRSHKNAFPISDFSVKQYAMAVHKSLDGKNINNQMFKHSVTELEAKLIDSFLIEHAQEIADAMFREYFASIFDGVVVETGGR